MFRFLYYKDLNQLYAGDCQPIYVYYVEGLYLQEGHFYLIINYIFDEENLLQYLYITLV